MIPYPAHFLDADSLNLSKVFETLFLVRKAIQIYSVAKSKNATSIRVQS